MNIVLLPSIYTADIFAQALVLVHSCCICAGSSLRSVSVDGSSVACMSMTMAVTGGAGATDECTRHARPLALNLAGVPAARVRLRVWQRANIRCRLAMHSRDPLA